MLVIAAGLLSPNVGLIFWIALTFLLFLVVLRRMAWGPIMKALDERERNIHSSITRAEKALAEAKQIQADNEKARLEAEQQAQRILREAREGAEKLRAEEIDKTKVQLTRMQAQAQQEIDREKNRAVGELRGEVADLAIGAAEKILAETLDADRQRKLVDGFISGLRKN